MTEYVYTADTWAWRFMSDFVIDCNRMTPDERRRLAWRLKHCRKTFWVSTAI